MYLFVGDDVPEGEYTPEIISAIAPAGLQASTEHCIKCRKSARLPKSCLAQIIQLSGATLRPACKTLLVLLARWVVVLLPTVQRNLQIGTWP